MAGDSARRGFGARRSAWADGCGRGVVARQGSGADATADERAERRIAVQRRVRHRRFPVRHRGGRQRCIRSGRIDHAIRGVLLRWRFLRHRRGHGGRRGVRNDAFPRLGNDDHTYSDGAVPAVHPVFGRGGGARFRHSFGGGRRPAYPLRPHRHRPECGTYEHRLIQRMGGAVVLAERHRVHSARHAAAKRDDHQLGRSARQQLAAAYCDSCGFRSGDRHALPVDLTDAAARARHHHRQAAQDDGETLAVRRGDDVRWTEGHHHAVSDVHDSVHAGGRRGFPDARRTDLHRRRCDRGDAAAGEFPAAAACAESQ